VQDRGGLERRRRSLSVPRREINNILMVFNILYYGRRLKREYDVTIEKSSMYRPAAAAPSSGGVVSPVITEWPRDARVRPSRAYTLYGRRTFLFRSESTGDNR